MPVTYPDIPRPGDPTFTTFPKSLPDDCISYTLHVLNNPPLAAPAIRSRLLEIRRAADKLCKKLLSGYIWQREGFGWEVVDGEDEGWHFAGSTSFGESIADEWLIVYILRELSKEFEDAWIRVVDADGEFLLIEAANALPKWLNPEIADWRVWINRGQLRIIPREPVSESKDAKTPSNKSQQRIPRNLKLVDALEFIKTSSARIIHSPLIEAEAFYRLRNYPAAIAESMHTALITIPRNLAYVLRRTPVHITAATEAFYLRDPISLRPLQDKKGEKLKFLPMDLVTMSVKFTRVGYAQTKSQEFNAPAVWRPVLQKNLSPKEKEQLNMGMKLSCGFEMLVADPQNRDRRAVREIGMLLEDVDGGEEELPTDDEIKTWPQLEDDEHWLDVNYEDFERELSGRGKEGKGGSAEKENGAFGDKAAQENLRRMVERFEQFLNDDDAGAEGVDVDDMDFDDDDEDDEDGEESDDPDEDRDASFDEEEFAKMMKEMMGMPTADPSSKLRGTGSGRVEEINSDDESEEEEGEEDLKRVMQRMEEELREAGALDLNPSAGGNNASTDDPRYQLAKNLLESFKGQAGAAGPTGNLMASLGFMLPRDEAK